MRATKAWLSAFRLRTLPLSFSCILLGSLIAYNEGLFNWVVLILSLLTTTCLQVLSNLSNDYGDSISGVDNDQRQGPHRAVQSGLISLSSMKIAIIITGLLSLVFGCSLVWIALVGRSKLELLVFLGLGVLAIFAAIKYTVGKKPYGYQGLGDLAVFLFFGVVGVLGVYYLHTHRFSADILLPATSIGLLSVGVLNLNNMRDVENDERSGKRTLVVLIGLNRAKIYHVVLLITAVMAAVAYQLLNYSSISQWLFLICLPMLLVNIRAVFRSAKSKDLDPLLKKLAITTFLFSLAFGIGLIL